MSKSFILFSSPRLPFSFKNNFLREKNLPQEASEMTQGRNEKCHGVCFYCNSISVEPFHWRVDTVARTRIAPGGFAIPSTSTHGEEMGLERREN